MYSHGNTDLKGKGTHAVITLAEDLVVAVPVGYIITQCEQAKPGARITGTVVRLAAEGQKEIIVQINGATATTPLKLVAKPRKCEANFITIVPLTDEVVDESTDEDADADEVAAALREKFRPGVLAVLAGDYQPGGQTPEGDVGVVTVDPVFADSVKLRMGNDTVTEWLALDQLKVAPPHLKMKGVKPVFFAPAG